MTFCLECRENVDWQNDRIGRGEFNIDISFTSEKFKRLQKSQANKRILFFDCKSDNAQVPNLPDNCCGTLGEQTLPAVTSNDVKRVFLSYAADRRLSHTV